MQKQEILKYLGKKVMICYKRRRKFYHKKGVLTDLSGHFCCIKNKEGRNIWFILPKNCNTSIKELKE